MTGNLPMSGPGKFEGLPEIAEYVYQLTLDPGPDVEAGSVDESGAWYGIVRKPFSASDASEVLGRQLTQDEEQFLEKLVGAIVTEDSNGFIYVEWHRDEEEMEYRWEDLTASLEDA